MRALFDVASASGSHTVYLTEGSIADTLGEVGGQVVIADARFEAEAATCGAPVIGVEAVEEEKTLTRVTDLIGQLRRGGLTRDGRITSLGGGIVQDVSCFAASVYMRGVEWTYVPTTLLAMVDSCIGGKSSINVGEFKNIAGTFHPPAAIVIAPRMTETLPPEHMAAGLCEAAKITFARGDAEFDRYLTLYDGLDADRLGRIADIVEHSLRCKKWFIEVDEFDRAERLLLNFGHSFGHAIESATHYDLNHGVAVGVGMLAALRASEAIEPAVADLPDTQRLRAHVLELLAALPVVATALRGVTRDAFLGYFSSDKKHSSDRFRVIVVDGTGRLTRRELPRDTAGADVLWNAFDAARRDLGLEV